MRYRIVLFALLLASIAHTAPAAWTPEQRCEQVRMLWDQVLIESSMELSWLEKLQKMGYSPTYSAGDQVVARHSGGGCATYPGPMPDNCDLPATETNPFDQYTPALVSGCTGLLPGQIGIEQIQAGPYNLMLKFCRDLSSVPECGEPTRYERLLLAEDSFTGWSSMQDARCEMLRNLWGDFGRRINWWQNVMWRSSRGYGTPSNIDETLETFIYHFTGQGSCTAFPLMPPDWCTELELRPNPLNPGSMAVKPDTTGLLPGEVGIAAAPPPYQWEVELCVHYGDPGTCPFPASGAICTTITLKD